VRTQQPVVPAGPHAASSVGCRKAGPKIIITARVSDDTSQVEKKISEATAAFQARTVMLADLYPPGHTHFNLGTLPV
jgi:hypothetical protein